MEGIAPVFLIAAVVVILFLFMYYVPVLMWFSARVSGVRISLLQLVLMRVRKVPPGVIVRALIIVQKAGLDSIKRDELEAHYLAGGHIDNA